MVAYETWVSIVRSTADRKGANLSDFETNSDLVSVAGAIWRDRKDEIKASSERQAREIADGEVSVS